MNPPYRLVLVLMTFTACLEEAPESKGPRRRSIQEQNAEERESMQRPARNTFLSRRAIEADEEDPEEDPNYKPPALAIIPDAGSRGKRYDPPSSFDYVTRELCIRLHDPREYRETDGGAVEMIVSGGNKELRDQEMARRIKWKRDCDHLYPSSLYTSRKAEEIWRRDKKLDDDDQARAAAWADAGRTPP